MHKTESNIQVAWGQHTYSCAEDVKDFGSHGGSQVLFEKELTTGQYVSDNGSSVTLDGLLTVKGSFDVEGGSNVKAKNGLVVMTDRVHVGNGSRVVVDGPLVLNGIDMSMVENWRDYVKVDPGSSFIWNPAPPTCFLAGTMIRMADGTEKAVEDIRMGDMVMAYNPKKVA